MIFYCKADGTVYAHLADAVYQGSTDVNDIIFIAPFLSTAVVSVIFTLPNGRIITPKLADAAGRTDDYDYNMSPQPGFELYSRDGIPLNVWRRSVDFPLTEVSGDLGIQFMVSWLENGRARRKTTSLSTITIGKGGNYINPSVSEENLNEIANYLAAANSAKNAAEESRYDASESSLKAEGYAIGRQNGHNVEEGSEYYQNNAEYYATDAKICALVATSWANKAIESAGTAERKANDAGASAGSAADSASQAADSASQAAKSASQAAKSAEQTHADYDSLSKEVSELSNEISVTIPKTYAKKEDISSVYRFKGATNILPTSASVGDVYNVPISVTISGVEYPPGTNWAWTGYSWDALGGAIKLDDYSEWDLIITDVVGGEDYTLPNQLAKAKGKVLVKGINIYDFTVPSAITLIEFSDCNFSTDHYESVPNPDPIFGSGQILVTEYCARITGHSNCTIRGVDVTATETNGQNPILTISGFGAVEHCVSDTRYHLNVTNCERVLHCSLCTASNTKFISDCSIISDHIGSISGCSNINNVYADADGGSDTPIEFTDCHIISNVRGGVQLDFSGCSHISNVTADTVTYTNCTYVDPFTCKDAVILTYEGRAIAFTIDGTLNYVLPAEGVEF